MVRQREVTKVSRRSLLRRAAVLVGGATAAIIVTACGETSSPTALAPAGGGATAAPKPSMAPSGTPTVVSPTGVQPSSAPAQTGKAKVTLTYTNNSTGSDKAVQESLITEFAKTNPNIIVNYTPIPADSWGGYFDKVATLIAGGTPPDVSRIAIEGAQHFASRDLSLPLDSFISNEPDKLGEYYADVYKPVIDVFVTNGKTYGLPFAANTEVMFYNKKMFQDAGVPLPTEMWTKDQFIDAAQKLTKRSGSGDPQVYGFGFPIAYFNGAIPFIFSNGSNLLTDDLTKSQANDPKVVEAITLMRDMVWDLKVAPKPTTNGNDIVNLFAARKIAMMPGARNPIGALKAAGLSTDEYDIAPWPSWKANVTEFGVGASAILKSSKYPQEAWQWVKFLTSPTAIAFLTLTGGSVPARRSVANSDAMFKDAPANSKIFYALLEKGSKAVPAPKQYSRVEESLLRNLGQIYANETPPDKGMDVVHKELTTILAAP